jgi:hypothetical protein
MERLIVRAGVAAGLSVDNSAGKSASNMPGGFKYAMRRLRLSGKYDPDWLDLGLQGNSLTAAQPEDVDKFLTSGRVHPILRFGALQLTIPLRTEDRHVLVQKRGILSGPFLASHWPIVGHTSASRVFPANFGPNPGQKWATFGPKQPSAIPGQILAKMGSGPAQIWAKFGPAVFRMSGGANLAGPDQNPALCVAILWLFLVNFRPELSQLWPRHRSLRTAFFSHRRHPGGPCCTGWHGAKSVGERGRVAMH